MLMRSKIKFILLGIVPATLFLGSCDSSTVGEEGDSEANSQDTVVQVDENDGFVEIFDGESLDGWDGDTTYWSVENGNLVGEVTPTTLLKTNTFIIWQGGVSRQILN